MIGIDLRVKWNISKYTLRFQAKTTENSLTRHRLLSSMLSSIYDPFGLGIPFSLKKRLIIQQLRRDKLVWDEPTDEKSSYECFKMKKLIGGNGTYQKTKMLQNNWV